MNRDGGKGSGMSFGGRVCVCVCVGGGVFRNKGY